MTRWIVYSAVKHAAAKDALWDGPNIPWCIAREHGKSVDPGYHVVEMHYGSFSALIQFFEILFLMEQYHSLFVLVANS